MEEKDAQKGDDLANQILKALDHTKTDPLLAYAALGSAFIQLHIGLGHGKKEWIETTQEMAVITWDKK